VHVPHINAQPPRSTNAQHPQYNQCNTIAQPQVELI
jgi:hypothetical protein